MRVSKPPEERKREMIDTAMKLFAKKGYEAVTMTDIAREMNVVSGLCYRYFKSKEELYHEALKEYAKECAEPMIYVMEQEYTSAAEYIEKIQQVFLENNGREKYHDFFHSEGNDIFHRQLEYEMQSLLEPHMIALIEYMNTQGFIQVTDCKATALFILYGQMPIINDESIPTEERIRIVMELIGKLVFN